MSNQIEFFEIPSPCKRVCETDKQGYCLACFRSRDERFNWLTYSDDQKREVIRLCRQRLLRKKYLYLQAKKMEKITQDGAEVPQLDLF